MAELFFDTSALLKRWVREPGSERVRALTHRTAGHRVLVTRLLAVEAVASIGRRAQGDAATDAAIRRAIARVRRDVETRFRVVEIGGVAWQLALDLAERHRIRGADAVHLAAACVVHDRATLRGAAPLRFLTSDVQQLAAAKAEGLDAEDPAATSP